MSCLQSRRGVYVGRCRIETIDCWNTRAGTGRTRHGMNSVCGSYSGEETSATSSEDRNQWPFYRRLRLPQAESHCRSRRQDPLSAGWTKSGRCTRRLPDRDGLSDSPLPQRLHRKRPSWSMCHHQTPSRRSNSRQRISALTAGRTTQPSSPTKWGRCPGRANHPDSRIRAGEALRHSDFVASTTSEHVSAQKKRVDSTSRTTQPSSPTKWGRCPGAEWRDGGGSGSPNHPHGCIRASAGLGYASPSR